MNAPIMHMVGAGLDESGLQRCIFCGHILLDASPETLANTFTTSPGCGIGTWPTGTVTVDGNQTAAGELPGARWCTEVARV